MYCINVAVFQMTLSQLSEEDCDGYEEITPSPCPLPSALDLVSVTHHRSLWCELLQVRNSGLLGTVINLKLQNARCISDKTQIT